MTTQPGQIITPMVSGLQPIDTGGPMTASIQLQQGTVTLNGATSVSVTGLTITANSDINFTLKTVGGTVGAAPSVKTITTGANGSGSFTVAGTAADTSVYNFLITG